MSSIKNRRSNNTVAARQSPLVDAVELSPADQLLRTLMTCLLWEDNFYENGVSVADRITKLVPLVAADEVHAMAVEARDNFGLRHAPLLVARAMARGPFTHREQVRRTLAEIIKRPDEIAEFLALYWSDNNGKKFVSHGVRDGLERAMRKFNEFQFSKWDKPGKDVRIRDAMFMSHCNPNIGNDRRYDKEVRRAVAKGAINVELNAREQLFAKLANDELKQTGTWEDRLSAGGDAKAVFTELIEKGELGGLAFVRNIRKMEEVGIPKKLIETYSKTVNLKGIFPHQLLTSARVNPQYESMFDAMMLRQLSGIGKMEGSTVVLVDVSGSMDSVISTPGKSSVVRPSIITTTRVDVAAAVAILAREMFDKIRVFTFSDRAVEVPSRRGIALRDAIRLSQPHSSTYLAGAIDHLNKIGYERLIVITDEQSHDGGGSPLRGARNYMLNVAPHERSVAQQDRWISISGWSPQVLKYIQVLETSVFSRESDISGDVDEIEE